MKHKEIKNPDSPGGRKDWKGRTPRQRSNFTNAQLNILKEVFETYFNKYPEKRTDQTYSDLYERICQHAANMQTPLMSEVEDFPLFEQEWDFDEQFTDSYQKRFN